MDFTNYYYQYIGLEDLYLQISKSLENPSGEKEKLKNLLSRRRDALEKYSNLSVLDKIDSLRKIIKPILNLTSNPIIKPSFFLPEKTLLQIHAPQNLLDLSEILHLYTAFLNTKKPKNSDPSLIIDILLKNINLENPEFFRETFYNVYYYRLRKNFGSSLLEEKVKIAIEKNYDILKRTMEKEKEKAKNGSKKSYSIIERFIDAYF